jgi:hypothetical protein
MDSQSGFLAYSNYAAKTLASMPSSAGMGACSEILIEAFRGRLRIKEVQVNNISYNTGFETSTENPLFNRMSVLTFIIQYTVIRRPLLLIGIPSIAILSIRVRSLLSLIDIYNNTKVIAVGLDLFTVATNTIGLFILLTFIILYTLSNISKEVALQSKQMHNFNRSMDVGTNHKDSDNWYCRFLRAYGINA